MWVCGRGFAGVWRAGRWDRRRCHRRKPRGLRGAPHVPANRARLCAGPEGASRRFLGRPGGPVARENDRPPVGCGGRGRRRGAIRADSCGSLAPGGVRGCGFDQNCSCQGGERTFWTSGAALVGVGHVVVRGRGGGVRLELPTPNIHRRRAGRRRGPAGSRGCLAAGGRLPRAKSARRLRPADARG